MRKNPLRAANKHQYFSLLPTLLLTYTLTACSGGDDEDNTPVPQEPPTVVAPTPISGLFLDSPVIGIGYRTQTLEGITDTEGRYDYIEGETVTFHIGDLEFPATEASGIVTPLDIANTEDVTTDSVVNMARLLQTLDQDSNPSNGITITQTALDSAEPVNFDLAVSEFAASSAVLSTVANGGQDTSVSELISEEAALSHLTDELTKNNIQVGIVGSWLASVDENDLLSITFFNDGTYVLFEVDSDDSTEESGMEWGTYQRDNDNRVFTTQNFDKNGSVGLNDFGVETGDPQLFAKLVDGNLILDVDEDADGNIDEVLTFTALATTAELGPWLIRDIDGEPDENDLLMFVFYDDGTYVHAEVDFSDQDEKSGMEWGEYSIDSASNKVSVDITFDANGDTGLTDFTLDPTLGLFLSVSDDVLSLGVDENGDNKVDETLFFTRP